MASITDVAKRAGLSIASVSRVLNGSANVTPATRERVLEAASELRYSIDLRARGLRRQQSGTLGLIVADAENPFFTQIVHAIEAVTYESKRNLFLCNSDEDPEREQLHLAAMQAQRIDGILLLPVGSDAGLLDFGRPLVCLDRRLPGAPYDLAIVDNMKGSELAVRDFVAHGHTRLAIVTAHDPTVSVERMAGYRATLAALGIAERPEYSRRGSNARRESGYHETSVLLELPEPPTALFVTNQLLLLGALAAIRDGGLRVPADISVIGFDDTPYAELLDPPLTTVAQPIYAIGTAAAQLLLDRVDRGYTGPARTIVLPPKLIARASVAAAR